MQIIDPKDISSQCLGGTDFHSTEVMLVHDGSTVTLTQYGTLKDANLATIDADISGSNVRLKVTVASATSTVIKFDRTLVELKTKTFCFREALQCSFLCGCWKSINRVMDYDKEIFSRHRNRDCK